MNRSFGSGKAKVMSGGSDLTQSSDVARDAPVPSLVGLGGRSAKVRKAVLDATFELAPRARS